jgi:hypothetical protein
VLRCRSIRVEPGRYSFNSVWTWFEIQQCVTAVPWLLHQKTVPCKPFSVPFTVPIVPCKPFSVPFSVRIVLYKPFTVPSKAFQSFKAFPHSELPHSFIVNRSTCRIEIYKYFRKTIKMLRLILSVYLRVYVLHVEGDN